MLTSPLILAIELRDPFTTKHQLPLAHQESLETLSTVNAFASDELPKTTAPNRHMHSRMAVQRSQERTCLQGTCLPEWDRGFLSDTIHRHAQ
eukprot:466316-Amphidinium_carterae.1